MAKGLEWVLRHPGAEDLGLDFDGLPGLDPAPVTDACKADFVRRKVRHVLLECRRDGLGAVRSGFWQAMVDLSPEATPFLRLLSATDWSLLLCGEDGLTAEAVADTLRFSGYPKQSRIPAWLPLAVEQFSPENHRRFFIFCTGGALASPRRAEKWFKLLHYFPTFRLKHQMFRKKLMNIPSLKRRQNFVFTHTCDHFLDWDLRPPTYPPGGGWGLTGISG